MTSETWFKLAFIGAFVYALAVAAASVRRATRRHGGGVNQLQHEVRWLVAVRAALGLVFYVSLGGWFVDADWFESTRLPLAPALRWFGVWALAPLLAFYTWAFRSLGANYRGGVGLHAHHELVTGGAYRWMRHPIYAAFIAIMLDVAALSASWLLGGAGLLLVASIAAGRIPVEERELRERFGGDWARYCERTGRFARRLRGF